jgi:hypothetical protein
MYDASAIRLGMPAEMFAALGEKRLAYIKPTRSEDVAFLSADAPVLQPGYVVFVLHAADVTPIVLTDSHESALADAETHELEAVSIH